jgi:hypothetical protein
VHIQGNRRVLATDEWLRVLECDGVYAIGDCATINQRRVMVCNGSPLLVVFVNIKNVLSSKIKALYVALISHDDIAVLFTCKLISLLRVPRSLSIGFPKTKKERISLLAFLGVSVRLLSSSINTTIRSSPVCSRKKKAFLGVCLLIHKKKNLLKIYCLCRS